MKEDKKLMATQLCTKFESSLGYMRTHQNKQITKTPSASKSIKHNPLSSLSTHLPHPAYCDHLDVSVTGGKTG